MHVADVGEQILPDFKLSVHGPGTHLNNFYAQVLMQAARRSFRVNETVGNFFVEFKLRFTSVHVFSLFWRNQATVNGFITLYFTGQCPDGKFCICKRKVMGVHRSKVHFP